MASQISGIRSKVTSRIQDGAAKLTLTALTGDVDLAILSALAEYQKVKPREVVVSVAGNGGFDYLVSSALVAFVDGFSSILSVIAPYSASEQNPSALDEDDYTLARLPGGLYLRLRSNTLAASESMLVAYSAPHTLNETTSTVSPADDDALADLASAEACESLAAVYAQSTDSTIGADAVDHKGKSSTYRELASSFRERYERKLGVGKSATSAPAGTHVDIDRRMSDTEGSDLTLHGRRRF